MIVIAFVIVANIMKSIVNITDSMVDMITGSMMSLTQGGGPGSSASQALLSVVGLDKETQGAIVFCNSFYRFPG